MSGASLSKPTMNPPRTRKPDLLDPFYACDEIAVCVLEFAAFLERAVIGRLYADEYGFKTRPDHLPHQLLVVGKVDRGLCREIKGVSSPSSSNRSWPAGHLSFSFFLLPMKLSSTKKTPAPPAGVMERFQLRDYLIGALRTGAVAVEGRDVAEFAAERDSPGSTEGSWRSISSS